VVGLLVLLCNLFEATDVAIEAGYVVLSIELLPDAGRRLGGRGEKSLLVNANESLGHLIPTGNRQSLQPSQVLGPRRPLAQQRQDGGGAGARVPLDQGGGIAGDLRERGLRGKQAWKARSGGL
jgi:hypothetical protein